MFLLIRDKKWKDERDGIKKKKEKREVDMQSDTKQTITNKGKNEMEDGTHLVDVHSSKILGRKIR